MIMKNFKFLYYVLFAAVVPFLSSCGDDDNVALPPSLEFVGAAGTGSATVAAGDSVTVKFIANAGDANLSTVTVQREGLSYSKYGNNGIKNISGSTHQDSVRLAAPSSGSFTYTIAVTDKDGLSASREFTVSGVTMSSYTAKLLGAQNAAAGSYFDATTGTVFTSSQLANSASAVDITFAVTGPTTTELTPKLISPDNRVEEGLTSDVNQTATFFSTSTLDFATVTTSQLAAITAGTNKSITITQDGVYQFVTAAGERGLVKVTNLNAGLATDNFDTEATIDVKLVK